MDENLSIYDRRNRNGQPRTANGAGLPGLADQPIMVLVQPNAENNEEAALDNVENLDEPEVVEELADTMPQVPKNRLQRLKDKIKKLKMEAKRVKERKKQARNVPASKSTLAAPSPSKVIDLNNHRGQKRTHFAAFASTPTGTGSLGSNSKRATQDRNPTIHPEAVQTPRNSMSDQDHMLNDDLEDENELLRAENELLRDQTLSLLRQPNDRTDGDGGRTSATNPENQLKFAMKHLKPFTGKEQDTFESWLIQAKYLLRESNMSTDQQKQLLLCKLEGNARKLVETNNLFAPEDIFTLLIETYGEDRLTLMASTKQLPEESAKMFLGRLRTNFGSMGLDRSTKEELLQQYFVSGLLPAINDKLKILFPTSLQSALQMATRIEAYMAETKESRKQP